MGLEHRVNDRVSSVWQSHSLINSSIVKYLIGALIYILYLLRLFCKLIRFGKAVNLIMDKLILSNGGYIPAHTKNNSNNCNYKLLIMF